jgi:hypothetical protein
MLKKDTNFLNVEEIQTVMLDRDVRGGFVVAVTKKPI